MSRRPAGESIGLSLLLLLGVSATGASLVDADEFILQSGARIRGQWVNRHDRPLKSYVIRTEQGGRLTLDSFQVVEAVRHSAAEAEYERIAPSFGDTEAEQWKLAEWCRQRGLAKQREDHLRRIVELNPQHVPAWHALGYSQIGGRWVTRDGFLTEQGYVYYRGKWLLPQQVELLEERRRIEQAEGEWLANLKRWREQLSRSKGDQALERIRSIRDPLATRALAVLLGRERDRRVKLVYVEVLGQIRDDRALAALLAAALNDPDEETFHACVERIVPRKIPQVVEVLAQTLKDENNIRVNRAANALGRLGDRAAIPPLIDALVTTHQIIIPGSETTTVTMVRLPGDGPAQGPGHTGAVGSAGVAGHARQGIEMSGPRGLQAVLYQVPNQEALDALVKLTGGVSFGFDQRAWRNWHAIQQKQQQNGPVNARRD